MEDKNHQQLSYIPAITRFNKRRKKTFTNSKKNERSRNAQYLQKEKYQLI